MKLRALGILISMLSFGVGQDAPADSIPAEVLPDSSAIVAIVPDTTQMDSINTVPVDITADSTVNDTLGVSATATKQEPEVEVTTLDSIPPEYLGLEYGYKGYPWGADPSRLPPRMAYMDSMYYTPDSTGIIVTGELGKYPVTLYYVFSDSGFWKVEIDYEIDANDMDAQINQFYAIEKSLYEVYRKPHTTNQSISGPKPGTHDFSRITYERAYLHTSWQEMPCQIDLILFSAVQKPQMELPLISHPTSMLRLIYFNPDYMVDNLPQEQVEKLPSIFDLY
ncbi:MAG: hypothetical protein ACE5D8_08750 [Fidelibacterota bacterium]